MLRCRYIASFVVLFTTVDDTEFKNMFPFCIILVVCFHLYRILAASINSLPPHQFACHSHCYQESYKTRTNYCFVPFKVQWPHQISPKTFKWEYVLTIHGNVHMLHLLPNVHRTPNMEGEPYQTFSPWPVNMKDDQSVLFNYLLT